MFCKIKTKETKCPWLPGSRGYRINKLASNLSVMSTLQLGRAVRPGLVSRHGSEIGLEATLGLIKIINMPIYLLLLELAKNSHVSHHETVRRNRIQKHCGWKTFSTFLLTFTMTNLTVNGCQHGDSHGSSSGEEWMMRKRCLKPRDLEDTAS